MLEEIAADLEWVNSQVEAVQVLAPTVGDEFQAVYSSLGAALDSTLLLRLRRFVTEPDLPAGLRFGIGEGEVVQAHGGGSAVRSERHRVVEGARGNRPHRGQCG